MPSRPRNRAEVVGDGTVPTGFQVFLAVPICCFCPLTFQSESFQSFLQAMTLLLLLFKEHFFFPPRQPTCPLPLGPEMDSSSSFIPFCSFFLSVYADVEKESKRTKESLTVEDKERKVCVVLLKRLLSPTLCVSLGSTYMSHSYLGLPGSLDVISLIDAPLISGVCLYTWAGL